MTSPSLRAFDPADIAWLTEAHQTLYAAEEGFDDTFGPLVRSILETFAGSHDPSREAGWIAQIGDAPVGSIFCVRHSDTHAKLRLFLLLPWARGQGLGRVLLDACTTFARAKGYQGMTLWTHAEHKAACRLYERAGWTCTCSEPVHSFGRDLTEQTWVLDFFD